MKHQLFDPIHLDLPQERVYRRLGYRQGVTRLSAQRAGEVEKAIDEARGLLRLKGVALRLSAEKAGEGRLVLGGAGVESPLLSNLLSGCEEALMMGVTAGADIAQAIGALQREQLSRAVVFDAVASEYADACFDWLQNYYNRQLSREDKRLLDKRISCGYAGFPLEYQAVFFKLLQLERLGVSLNESYVLCPEKSATAVTGIVPNQR